MAFDLVDSSPVLVSEIPTEAGPIAARQPFAIPLILDETQQYLLAVFPPLALDLGARTRQELTLMIEEDLEALWRNIATANDDCLAPDARMVKHWLPVAPHPARIRLRVAPVPVLEVAQYATLPSLAQRFIRNPLGVPSPS